MICRSGTGRSASRPRAVRSIGSPSRGFAGSCLHRGHGWKHESLVSCVPVQFRSKPGSIRCPGIECRDFSDSGSHLAITASGRHLVLEIEYAAKSTRHAVPAGWANGRSRVRPCRAAGGWQLRQHDTQRLNGVQIAGALMEPIKDAPGVGDHGERMFHAFVECMDMTKKWNGSHRLLLSCRQVS